MDLKSLTKDTLAEKQSQSLVSARKVAKWEKTGLLEGLDARRKSQMARLLENEASYLMEASDTTDIKGFQAIAFPMVRRVFGNLLVQEIASVQPMALPSGLVFWLDFTFGTAKAGTGRDDWSRGGSVFGNPVAPLTGGVEGRGGHYYLHNSYTQFEASGAVAIGTSGSATWAEVNFDPELSAAVALGQLFKVSVDLDDAASITNIDKTNFKSMSISGTVNSLVNSYYRRHNDYNPVSNVLTVFYSGSQRLNSGSTVQAAYVKKDVLGADTTGTTLNPAFEYAFDGSDAIPEIDIKIASHPVTANSRKLKVKWTPEVAQDLNAYHTVDAEAELTQIMADQVALDIDTEVLMDMVNNARAAKFYWDRRPGFFLDKETGERLTDSPNFTGNVQEWYLTLMETVIDVSNTIHRKNLRAGANFIVTSPDVATILESMVQWRPSIDVTDTTQTKYSMGIEKIGTLANRFTVYKAPFFFRNILLVGYKGEEWLTTGYVYAPYIPMIVTPTIYEPDNFTPRKAVMTRYAKQIIRGDYYGLVVVKGMGIF
jgi:hypothetical protein